VDGGGLFLLWSVVCGLWSVVCGLWSVVCGLWSVVCGLFLLCRSTLSGRHGCTAVPTCSACGVLGTGVMDAPLLDASVEGPSTAKTSGFTVPSVRPLGGKSNSLIETGLMATLLRIRLPKLDVTVETKNIRMVIVGVLGILSSILQNEVRAPMWRMWTDRLLTCCPASGVHSCSGIPTLAITTRASPASQTRNPWVPGTARVLSSSGPRPCRLG
jgi:hypothetical protein